MKRIRKDVKDYVAAGAGIGVGTMIASKAGAPSGVMSGLGTMGSMMGVVGTATMGKHALRMVKKGYKHKKKYRRR